MGQRFEIPQSQQHGMQDIETIKQKQVSRKQTRGGWVEGTWGSMEKGS